MLLVICRPGRGEDVPFRSVASRLVRGGAEQMAGLDLDVLRPATFPRLAQVLHEAAERAAPTTWSTSTATAPTSTSPHSTTRTRTTAHGSPAGQWRRASGGGGVGVSPLRYGIRWRARCGPGQHGYLIFEYPADPSNQQLADGPALGRLLAATGVPVLVLNACRSAYAEAPSHPASPPTARTSAGSRPGDDAAAGTGGLADVHARIRAYGSLAAEVADAGVPGVVAMRYNVYVVTAAQYTADLYAHLLSGKPLGEAATAARRPSPPAPPADHHHPGRLAGLGRPRDLRSRPPHPATPAAAGRAADQAHASDEASADAGGGVPGPPDAGFFGRDETLLALDRAFDTQHGGAAARLRGGGKSSTAAEFARWYHATGGLDHPA